MTGAFAPPEEGLSPRALHRAFERALQGHRDDPEAAAFLLGLGPRLCALSRALLAGTWRPAPLRFFEIREPKARTVAVAGFADRVVHHALVGALERAIDPRLDPDSYACRRGKGLHRALRRTRRLAGRHRYCLGMDVRGYFASLPHRVVADELRRHGAPEGYLDLAGAVLEAGAAGGEPRGMPIGLLTSQFFGNVGLDPVERMLRGEHPELGHARYTDDLVVFGASKRGLWAAHAAVERTVEGLGLALRPEMTRLQPTSEGVPFLGFRVFPAALRLEHRALVRFARRVRGVRRGLGRGLLAEEEAEASLLSVFGHARHGQTAAFRRGLVRALWA